jgi:hypothetical protein
MSAGRLSEQDRVKLGQIAALFTSPIAGERDAALAAFCRLLQRSGTSWEAILAEPTQPQPQPTPQDEGWQQPKESEPPPQPPPHSKSDRWGQWVAEKLVTVGVILFVISATGQLVDGPPVKPMAKAETAGEGGGPNTPELYAIEHPKLGEVRGFQRFNGRYWEPVEPPVDQSVPAEPTGPVGVRGRCYLPNPSILCGR